ncbi:MAG: hypothetical protein IJM59_12435 [Proteobacteria bacterium]|nr:hypothetical protein [Pseudomonadota bacterium]
MKLLNCMIIASILCFAGCSKPAQPDPKPESVMQPTVDANHAGDEGAAKDAASPAAAPNEPKDANPKDAPEAKPRPQAVFKADLSSKAVPELHTHETVVSEAGWGKILRTTVEWADDIEVYHEIPVFDGDDAGILAVNNKMKEIRAGFLSTENLKSAWEFEYERHEAAGGEDSEDKYTYIYRAAVKEFSEKYISVTLDLEWYMGGVLDYGTNAYVFERATGKPLRLTDVYGKDAESVRKLVTRAVRAHVDANANSDLMEWGALEKMTDFSFYMDNGVPHAVFKKYEIAVGAAGAFDIELPKP